MRILLINCVCGIKSTGRICTDLAEKLEKEGHEVKIAYGREESVPEKYQKYAVRIGNDLDVKLHAIRTRVLDEHGFGSKRATRFFLKWADEFDPDMVWLHNIHGYYINVELLFEWIKSRPNMQVKWTLHDCWAFTGHCAYFTMANCEKWKVQCEKCPQKNKYPISNLKDNSRNNFLRKKKAFTGVKNMKLITPSKWLADLTRDSFLKEYPVEVQYNTIDTNVFKPTPSDFRKKYHLKEKKIVLGVASAWDERKGLRDFLKLSNMLNSEYAIVLVGLTQKEITDVQNTVEKKQDINLELSDVNEEQITRLQAGCVVPHNVHYLYKEIVGEKCNYNNDSKARVICIPKTNNVNELVKIYTTADYFVNPTYEDNYPTVNLEARACGTYVITYDTGGCAETLQ